MNIDPTRNGEFIVNERGFFQRFSDAWLAFRRGISPHRLEMINCTLNVDVEKDNPWCYVGPDPADPRICLVRFRDCRITAWHVAVPPAWREGKLLLSQTFGPMNSP